MGSREREREREMLGVMREIEIVRREVTAGGLKKKTLFFKSQILVDLVHMYKYLFLFFFNNENNIQYTSVCNTFLTI